MHKLISASEYCDNVFDGTHDTPKPKLEGKPLITSKHILGNKLDIVNAYNISSEDYDEINKRSQIHQWDILFSMIGTIGNIYLEESSDINYAIKNIGVFSCREEKKARYLYYYLQSSFAKQYIYKKLAGAVQKFLSLGELRCFPVPCFDEQLYNNINILAWIDKKIDLNNRINAELEVVARELYNYWFVQFDFPDEFRRPYKSSGGKMVYNEMLKREIPEGWEVTTLEKLLCINRQKATPNKDKKLIDLSIMPSKTFCLCNFNNGDALDTNLFTMNKYDILFGSIRPYLLKAGFAPFDGLVTGTVHSFSPKRKNEMNYLILTMTSDNIFEHAITSSKGTKMPVIGVHDLLDYKIPYSETVVSNFEKMLSFKETISENIIENILLSKIRDFLLPMLMNGQVSVS